MSPIKPDSLTYSEWKVMRSVWRHGSCSAREIHQELSKKEGWAISTVKTLLSRLVEKGHLKVAKDGNRFVYSPDQSALKSLLTAVDSLLGNVAGEMAAPLLMHLVKKSNLSSAEVAQLRALLNNYDSSEEADHDEH